MSPSVFLDHLVAVVAHSLGGVIMFVLALLSLRAGFVLEQQMLPCERTIIPRTATLTHAAPGEEVIITGYYRIERSGCTAMFYPMVTYSTAYGVIQAPQSTHPGSFEVSKKNDARQIGRRFRIPDDALVGTIWSSAVVADWDRWHFPLGLSVTRTVYQTVEVRVIERGSGFEGSWRRPGGAVASPHTIGEDLGVTPMTCPHPGHPQAPGSPSFRALPFLGQTLTLPLS